MNSTSKLGLALVAAIAALGTAQAGVVKTKTKSNQSNDRVAQTADLAAAMGAAFDSLDADHDGQLDASEQAGLPAIAPAGGEQARGAPLKGVDVKIGRGAGERVIRVTFSAHLDADGNGRIGKGEWMDDWQSQFAAADTDHDGSLNEGEAARFGWNVKSTEVR